MLLGHAPQQQMQSPSQMGLMPGMPGMPGLPPLPQLGMMPGMPPMQGFQSFTSQQGSQGSQSAQMISMSGKPADTNIDKSNVFSQNRMKHEIPEGWTSDNVGGEPKEFLDVNNEWGIPFRKHVKNTKHAQSRCEAGMQFEELRLVDHLHKGLGSWYLRCVMEGRWAALEGLKSMGELNLVSS